MKKGVVYIQSSACASFTIYTCNNLPKRESRDKSRCYKSDINDLCIPIGRVNDKMAAYCALKASPKLHWCNGERCNRESSYMLNSIHDENVEKRSEGNDCHRS